MARRPLTRSRAFSFALVTTVMVFALAEVALRLAGGVVLWRYRAAVSESAGSGGELWALGDSYTYGIGADEPAEESWPAIAASSLRPPMTLRNLAEPGLNSSGIVQRFEEALVEGTPDVVTVLAGVNNTRWLGQSGQFCLDDAPTSRATVGMAATGALGGLRVYKVLRQAVLAARPPRAVDRSCAAVAEGFQRLEEGRPERAVLAFERASRENPQSAWAQLGLGLARVREGRPGLALPPLLAAEDRQLSSPALGLATAFALRATGDHPGADARLTERQPGDLQHFAQLLKGWLAYDRGDLATARRIFDDLGDVHMAPHALSHGGVVPFGLDGRGWTLLAMGDVDGAEDAFVAANRVGGELHVTPHLLGWPHIGLAVLAWRRGEHGTAQALLEVACRDSAAAGAARAVGAWVAATAGDPQRARELIAVSRVVGPDREMTRQLEALLTRGGPIPTATEAPLPLPSPTVATQQWLDPADTRLVESDLRRIADLSRQAGARLIVVTYPQPKAHPELTEAHARAAESAHADFVDPRAAFLAEYQDLGHWEPLLIPDGHPTTRGHALMGRLVAEALQGEHGQGTEGDGRR
ncbi:MAG: hypothetical protein KDA24_13700 [Deltaproteobacteria bacterium]|nr:hypothetical protein [Deltaproteobacteria bacterium]